MIILDEYRLKLESLKKEISELGETIKISELERKYEDLERQTADPEFWNDQENSQKIIKEQKGVKEKISAFRELSSLCEDGETLVLLAEEECDDATEKEIVETVEKTEKMLEKQRLETLLCGEYDKNNAILSFHAGAGGTEAQDWAMMLFRMHTRFAGKMGFKVKVMDFLDGEEAGMKSADIIIEGENAFGFLKSENGVHRLVRISPFDASGRRHTSFAAVEVMPEISDDMSVDIREEDIRVDTYRSSGAGGQHVNKTESAIRITHLPTGTVVECQDERSQYKNKDRAMKILRSKLYEAEQARQNAAIAATRKSQVGTGDRSGKIRTYNFPQNRVTDHRLTGDNKNFNIAAVMNGDLDPMIDALILNDQAQRLQESKEE